MMTILIAFQTGNYRTFKHFYLYMLPHHRYDFPGLVSYKRFVNLIPNVMIPLFAIPDDALLGIRDLLAFALTPRRYA